MEIIKETAPYAPEEELGVYTATRWTWRQKQEAMMKASKVLDQTRGLVEVDLIDFQVEQILSCIMPPEGLVLDRERVNRLDADVGDILLGACRNVNGTTLSERTDFLEQSEQAEGTRG